MTITIEFNGKVAKIMLSDTIDYATQEEFKAANKEALSREGIREIQVDFAKAKFLDSAGIRALLTLQKGANASGKSLALLNCNDAMRDVFEIGGFDKVFTFH
jgi:anti-anti-sigma factor